MKLKDLRKILDQFSDDCEITIVDKDQNNCYEIIDFYTCDDNASEYKEAEGDNKKYNEAVRCILHNILMKLRDEL